MNNIIIENTKFDYNTGCRILKLKYEDISKIKDVDFPLFMELIDVWNDIKPLSFQEIAQLSNIEQRRVAILCLGMQRLIEEVEPTLIDTKTLNKTTSWVGKDGKIITKSFADTYELYKVDAKKLNVDYKIYSSITDCHFVKCKDTSTDRKYFIWVDLNSVNRNNHGWDNSKIPNAIEAIAWTIQTNVSLGNIEKIVRQGDCILIKPIDSSKVELERHLTKNEYENLLIAES